jgi:hypothetical protein
MENEEISQFNAPIGHWSYSSMLLFLRDRLKFKKGYILGIWDFKSGISAVVGSACHEGVASFWRDNKDIDTIKTIAFNYADKQPDEKIDFGKTGSREEIRKKINAGLEFYFSELPNYEEILGVEQTMQHFIEINDQEMPLPIKVKTDLVVRDNSEVIIVDHKFVSSFSDTEKDDPVKILQAMFNYYAVWKEYKEKPSKIIYHETKLSKNKDNSPQTQDYIIDYSKHSDYFDFFKMIYTDCTTEISKPDCNFLPNIGDFMGGLESYQEYRTRKITSEPAVKVSHTTQYHEYKEKKYNASTFDKVDYENLTDEEKVKTKLLEFGIAVDLKKTFKGPSIKLITFKVSRGVKMTSIEKYSKDLAIALKAKSIRVEAPIMGTDLVGVEIPRNNRTIIKYEHAEEYNNNFSIPIGIDVYGKMVRKDIADMPHLLVAGSTGSGKSVMINVIIQSLINQLTPDQLKFILIDPKRVELSQYKNSPYVMAGVITETLKAKATLNWLVAEMEERYNILEKERCKNIFEYNEKGNSMPLIITVIDEFADLVLQSSSTEDSLEELIIRLAQKARAVGISLILGTQRPSVDVVSGLLKANIPTRIAFMTSSRVDSQVILDAPGAEELIGKGDMLFLDPAQKGLQRLQGYLV